MVDKITIFEPHFDGAQFGPQTMPFPGTPEFEELKQLASGDTEAGEGRSEHTDDSKSKLVMLFQGVTVFLVLFVVLYVVLSKLTGDEAVEDVE